jgi:hypothetical protein
MYHIRWQYHWLKARLLALLPAMLVCTALAGLTGSLARADELNNFQDTSVQVTPHGLNALNKSWYWNLNISGYGYGTNIQPIATAATVVDGNRTEYRRGNFVSPSDLNGWLGNLETGLTSPALQKERIVIIGACYSGSYIPTVSKPGRIIVTSTTETEESYKGPKEPDEIRSGEYFVEALFSELGKGKSLQKSFNIATESVEILTRTGGNAPLNLRFQDWAAQHPLLDDNGDGKGSNILSAIWEKNQEGSNAKNTYLGLGKRFKISDPDNPAVIIKVTPMHYLKGSQTSAQLLATINNPERVANQEVIVDIRAPSVTLSSDGTEQKGQLEINGLQRMVLKLSAANKFTGNFAGFTEPGKYEIFYFVQDTITDEVSPLKRSIV